MTWPNTFPRTIRDSDVAAPSRMIAQGDAARFGIPLASDSGRFLIRFVSSLQNWSFGWNIISPRHSGNAVVLFANGHVGSESLRQLLYPSLDNWIRFNYDNKKHWRDSEMPDAETWESPTPWDELVDF